VGWGFGWLLCIGARKITVANVMTGEHMNMPVYHTVGQYLAIAAITLVACCSAGFFPARKASHVPPVDIIRGAT
jgi:ABC-type lipoprotein release transport system permease subunit